jgi:2-methylisocitrate lyase-like PEP mutase family enzyme
MTSQTEKAATFLALHRPGRPLLLPNPWDPGSARLLASLGFQALATTSSGFAATLGRSDGSVSREEALAHAAAIVAATDLPVSADLENCFADDPDAVATTVALAAETGLAGCSVEDYSGNDDEPIYDIGLAAERVAAAVEAAHGGPARLVLTARAENYLYGRPDLADTIRRLLAYQQAGADVLYAPGLTRLDDIRQLVSAVDRPVNILAMPGTPPVGELAGVGVSRVSVGGALAFAALGALVDAASELRDKGTYGYLASSAAGRRALKGVVLGRRTGQRSRDIHGDAPVAVLLALPDGRGRVEAGGLCGLDGHVVRRGCSRSGRADGRLGGRGSQGAARGRMRTMRSAPGGDA